MYCTWCAADADERRFEIIRLLWRGGYRSYDGRYLSLSDARVRSARPIAGYRGGRGWSFL
jgi:alkanesulfonate monooxygenase SsuD/methylene tetrahydromethanopterin reductase-like flavin-dependent oxidoreductase (luciferase family)